jgi:hypothetical protein
MAEGRSQGRAEEDAAAPEPGQAPIEGSQPEVSQPAASRRWVVWPLAVLGLVIAGIISSPFWAPEIAPLLPWGGRSPATMPDPAALTARLEAIERRPAPPVIDVEAIRSAQNALGRRVDQLEASRDAGRQGEATVAAIKGGLQQLEQQVGAIEVKSASRAAGEAAEVGKVQQELTRLGTTAAGLGNRLAALEHLRVQSGTQQRDAILLVALLQIREAVDQGRPFAAELGAFTALAHDRPDLVAAARPLAEAAHDGVVGRLGLAKRLGEVAGRIASATALPPQADWEDQVLARLRALVTIRRIDGAPQGGPEAAVSAAEAALGRGDLGDAVAHLDGLTGANAEAAEPWLKMARQRVGVEGSLAHLQQLLIAGLGHLPDAPGRSPVEAPAKPETQP